MRFTKRLGGGASGIQGLRASRLLSVSIAVDILRTHIESLRPGAIWTLSLDFSATNVPIWGVDVVAKAHPMAYTSRRRAGIRQFRLMVQHRHVNHAIVRIGEGETNRGQEYGVLASSSHPRLRGWLGAIGRIRHGPKTFCRREPASENVVA
jgi:hypothetical protein